MKFNYSTIALAAMATAGLAPQARAQLLTEVNAYAQPTWHADWVVEPIISVGDKVPRTSDPAQQYQMVGTPDGMGAYGIKGKLTVLNVSHEFGSTVLTEPVIGEPLIRGAFVSSYVLRNSDRAVLTGDLLFTEVFVDDTFVSPIASTANTTRGFARFCSSYQAGPWSGFDRYIFLAGEETDGDDSFDTKGGLTVAMFDGKAHALPGMGRYAKENVVARPATNTPGYKGKTVILIFEDGPNSDPWSGVFMYVGDRKPQGSALEINGLVGGKLYYLRSTDLEKNSESTVVEGDTVTCEWVEAPDAATQDYEELKAEMGANSFFTFSRPEDGHYNPRNPNQWIFCTTGEGDLGNALGRLYELNLNGANPTGEATLICQYDADNTTMANDGPLAPDNLVWDRKGNILVQEDGTSTSRPEYNNRNRNAGIWHFNYESGFGLRQQIVQQTDIGRDNILAHRGSVSVVGNQNVFKITQRGLWETSGIIAYSFLDGERSFDGYLFNVQAHGPTTAPAPNTREDGQILFMAPCKPSKTVRP